MRRRVFAPALALAVLLAVPAIASTTGSAT